MTATPTSIPARRSSIAPIPSTTIATTPWAMTTSTATASPACSDCDDNSASINASATEACDGVDNDCDGAIDEEGALGTQIWYADADGDGYGDPADAQIDCVEPEGYTTNSSDCNDASTDAFPGGVEICDGLDNDCDGATDNDAGDATTWHADGDGDGFGANSPTLVACEQPPGFVGDATDCDDAEPFTFPGAAEACDGEDDDCNGLADDGLDTDGDGYTPCDGDCDDSYPDIHEGALELCDAVDQNCDGDATAGAIDPETWYADSDGDGFGNAAYATEACEQPVGYVTDATDCDDSEHGSNPDADEECDGRDNNCDGNADEGLDTDGDGQTPCDGDCDDDEPTTFEGADELCDAVDHDCDGDAIAGATDPTTFYIDHDGDGFGVDAYTSEGCSQPTGFVATDDDCDDLDDTVNPDATDDPCDGVDNDCDETVDNDETALGEGSLCPAVSCDDVLGTNDDALDVGDDYYWLDSSAGAFEAWCDMTADGGGWTLVGTVANDGTRNWDTLEVLTDATNLRRRRRRRGLQERRLGRDLRRGLPGSHR